MISKEQIEKNNISIKIKEKESSIAEESEDWVNSKRKEIDASKEKTKYEQLEKDFYEKNKDASRYSHVGAIIALATNEFQESSWHWLETKVEGMKGSSYENSQAKQLKKSLKKEKPSFPDSFSNDPNNYGILFLYKNKRRYPMRKTGKVYTVNNGNEPYFSYVLMEAKSPYRILAPDSSGQSKFTEIINHSIDCQTIIGIKNQQGSKVKKKK